MEWLVSDLTGKDAYPATATASLPFRFLRMKIVHYVGLNDDSVIRDRRHAGQWGDGSVSDSGVP